VPPPSAFVVNTRPKEAPLLPKLRGQIAEFLNRDSPVALACSASLPVSVYGTGTYDLPRGFSWQRGVNHFGSEEPRIRFSALRAADLPTAPPTSLDAHIHPRADLSSCVTPSAHRLYQTMPGTAGLFVDRVVALEQKFHAGFLLDTVWESLNGRRW
jgi:hypothetical protein